jgi:hypothetical protein
MLYRLFNVKQTKGYNKKADYDLRWKAAKSRNNFNTFSISISWP